MNVYEMDILYRLVTSSDVRSVTVKIMDSVTEDDFADPDGREIFRAVREAWNVNGRLVPEAFCGRFHALPDIMTTESESRFFPLEDVIARLKIETAKRRTIVVANTLRASVGESPEKALETAARQVLEIRASLEAVRSGRGEYADAIREWRANRKSVALTAEDVYEKIIITREKGGRGFNTGLWWWDELAGRLRRGNTYVIAGYPGVGKTTLATNLGWSLAQRGKRVWNYCVELTSEESFEVLGGHIVGKSDLTEDDEILAYAAIQGCPYRFFEPPRSMSWQEHLALIERTARAERFDLVIVDNFGYLVRVGRNKTEAEEEASARLKGLAQELSIPIIVLHHLRKPESDQTEPEPTQHTVRGSGAICGDASDVFILHHPLIADADVEGASTRHPVGYLMCGKPRWGKGGKRYVRLDGSKRLYSPATWDEYPRQSKRASFRSRNNGG